MLLLCLSTLAGAYSLELFRQLPADFVFVAISIVSVVLLCRRKLTRFAFFLIGFVAMGVAAKLQLNDRLDAGLVGQKLAFSARIDSFPEREGHSTRFVVRPLPDSAQVVSGISKPILPQRIRISWHESPGIPAIGETWRLHVRLRRPRGYMNPGGFDFEGWLFREHIGATGFVDDFAPSYRIHGEPISRIAAARARIVARMSNVLPPDAARGVLMAIGAGARHAISREQWDLYARTGTSHLMAISGLHIGLAAGSAYILCWGALALITKRRNIRDAAAVAAVLAAGVYASLSGFGVPSRRALLMACVAGVALLLRRRLSAGPLLAIPCLTIFIVDPLAILSPGFKLSFAAVAILIIVSRQQVSDLTLWRWRRAGAALSGFRKLGMLQVALTLGMFPFTVLLFSRLAIVAPVANLLILPVFNLATVPLTLAGALMGGPFDGLGDALLRWAHESVRLVLYILVTIDNAAAAAFADLSTQTRRLSGCMVAVAIVPLLYVVLPAGWPGRKLAIVAVAVVLTHRPVAPPPGCLDYHVLDVGQGLSVWLQTTEQSLLFDTGPAFRSGSDTAQLVVLPFLRRQGIEHLDRLVISHGDLDHAGGVQSILAELPVDRILVGEHLNGISTPQVRCVAGVTWHADSVRFSVLHPRIRAPWTRNNSSCVLEVTVGQHRILLAGDIESPVEKLLDYRGAFRRSNIVIVPHHGSRTSSTASLVRATRPELAIVTAGFGNRWGFPKPDVVERWETAGATVLNTATAGSVSQRLCAGAPPGPVRQERLMSRKYWHDVP